MQRLIVGLLLLALLVAAAGGLAAYAQTGAGYRLDWWTVDTGGQQAATGGGYTLDTTAGQPEADPAASGGGPYMLQSSYWPGAREAWWLYLPVLKR